MTAAKLYRASWVLAVIIVLSIIAAGCGMSTYDNQEYYCFAQNKKHQISIEVYRDSTHTNHDTIQPKVIAFCDSLRNNKDWSSVTIEETHGR